MLMRSTETLRLIALTISVALPATTAAAQGITKPKQG